jgi:anti-sigma regulatory factor (Ser/Thr protein kinase)
MSTPKEVIRDLIAIHGTTSVREVSAITGLTRQAIQYHLTQMEASGELIRVGKGRATRYAREALIWATLKLEGLEEHEVWKDVERQLGKTVALKPNVRSIVSYAFTEMLNNAIDHSKGTEVRTAVWANGGKLSFDIVDDGRGAFMTVIDKFGLADNLTAIQELSKGKQTTDPVRHTGQGIFFTSKAVDRFELESNGTKWIVDNERQDFAVGISRLPQGTRVSCMLDVASSRILRDVFDAFTTRDSLDFTKTAPVVRLFKQGTLFVSRSEAKRLAANLEEFEEVILDFSGIDEVGQGFVDELFRVWATDHPGTRLVPMNMNPVVAAFVDRVAER